MSTPTHHIANPTPAEITSRLMQELRRQDSQTPEPVFGDEAAEEPYRWICEREHERFTAAEVDRYRELIPSGSPYWECEARYLKKVHSELVLDDLVRQYGSDWRKISRMYARKLKRNGLSANAIRERRRTISDQQYWKPEAEQLQLIAALREEEGQDRLRENAGHRADQFGQTVGRKKRNCRRPLLSQTASRSSRRIRDRGHLVNHSK